MSSCVPRFQHATSWQQLGSLLERLQGAGWPLLLVPHRETTRQIRIQRMHVWTNKWLIYHILINYRCVYGFDNTLIKLSEEVNDIQNV